MLDPKGIEYFQRNVQKAQTRRKLVRRSITATASSGLRHQRDVPGRNLVDFRQRGDVLEFFAEHFAVGQSPGIRHQARAHGPNGLVFATPFLDRELTVPLNQFPLLSEPGRNKMLSCGQISFHLPENPG